jgi:hypothetical protein
MRHDSDVMGSPQNIGIFHLIDGVLAAKDIHATVIVLIIYYRITIKIIKNVSIE